MPKKIVYALIPGKINSQAVHQKNLQKIKNRSLIEIAIDGAKKSKLIDYVYVSSESLIVQNICKKKKVLYFKRNKKFSTPRASSAQVVSEFIEKNKIKNNDVIIYLQPTSPLRKTKHINEGLKLFTNKNCKSVISIKKVDIDIFKCVTLKSKKTKAIFQEKYMTSNRQSFPDYYEPNGAIYIFLVKDFLNKKRIPTSDCYPYLMNEKDSTDIDSYSDLKEARKYFLKKY